MYSYCSTLNVCTKNMTTLVYDDECTVISLGKLNCSPLASKSPCPSAVPVPVFDILLHYIRAKLCHHNCHFTKTYDKIFPSNSACRLLISSKGGGFPLLHNVQIDSGTHSACHRPGRPHLRVKTLAREVGLTSI